jgi:uncharacterized protein YceH (UPF0502 family)
MHAFAGLGEVHDTLARLIERELVERLPRRPGHKEERYAQLLTEDSQTEADTQAPPSAEGDAVHTLQELSQRVGRIERELAELRAAVEPAARVHAQ